MTALPSHHRDAFDRLLVAQAQQPGLAILSADPALGRYDVEVLVLHGSDTKPYATRAARRVVDDVLNARIRDIPGAGHASPLTHPEALAEALTKFFAPAQQPA